MALLQPIASGPNPWITIQLTREQMNFGTAYLDGSGIYGATPESADKLREFDGGFLKVGEIAMRMLIT